MKQADNIELWLRQIAWQDDEAAFSRLFHHFFAPLCVFAYRYVEDQDTCEDLVQDTFYRIWKNRKTMDIQTSGKNFLLTSVRNACLDYLRKQESERHWSERIQEEETLSYTPDLYTTTELEHLLNTALAKLPEQVASTFRLNRFEGKTYSEIAEEKQVSVKTVEAYMSKALKFLRVELKDYLSVFIGFL